MWSGYMLIDVRSGGQQARCCGGALVWDTPAEALKALKKDCKIAEEDFEKEKESYEVKYVMLGEVGEVVRVSALPGDIQSAIRKHYKIE